MNWIKLTLANDTQGVWVNMRTHDYITVEEEAEGTHVTVIHVHDGDSLKVVETPEQIFMALMQEAERWRRLT